MIAPIVPPQAPLQELLHGPVTPPAIIRTADADVVVGMSTVGAGGRVLDRQIFARLGWRPGLRLDIHCARHGTLLVGPQQDGVTVMTDHGFFRVPYRLRRRVSLLIGDRTLLIGRRSRNLLVLHPPAAMDELFAASIQLLDR